MDRCQIRVVRSKDPLYGHSLLLYLCPGIKSLGGLVKISSAFRGGVSVSNMDALVTLDALRHVRSMGNSGDGTSINLQSNPNLQSVEALKGCCMDYRSKRLWVEDNPRLMCVPFSWPKKDKFDNVSDSQTAPTVQSHSISMPTLSPGHPGQGAPVPEPEPHPCPNKRTYARPDLRLLPRL